MRDIIQDFDFSGLSDLRHTVVRCANQEEANIFLDYLRVQGIWSASNAKRLASQWDRYGSSTCYHTCEPRWCDDEFYSRHGFRVIDFCDVYKPYECNAADLMYDFEEMFL